MIANLKKLCIRGVAIFWVIVLICATLSACGQSMPTAEPDLQTTTAEPDLQTSMMERDCDLFSISLPENLVEETPGTLFVDREKLVFVGIFLYSKNIWQSVSLEDFANERCNSVAEQPAELVYAENGSPRVTYGGYGLIYGTYMSARIYMAFYETEDCYIEIQFACKESELDSYVADFEQWCATIRIYDEPSGAIYNDENETVWNCYDLELHLDNSFVEYNADDADLCLINHLGEWIEVRRFEKKLTGREKNQWDFFEGIAACFDEAEVLPNGRIKYTYYNVMEQAIYKVYAVVLETDRYWCLVEFAAPAEKYELRVSQFEKWQAAVQVLSTPIISKPKSNAAAAVRNVHDETFGRTSAEFTHVYENEQIAISVAKMTDDYSFVYAAEKTDAWRATQILNCESIVLTDIDGYYGCAYRIDNWIAVIIRGDSTEVSDTLNSELIELPECHAQLLILPAELPADYALTVNGVPFSRDYLS